MKSKAIGKIFFWCVVFGIHIFLCHKIISSYREYQKTLEGLETPVEMSEVFMTSEYDCWWDHIDKVALGRRDPRSGLDIYEIWADMVPDMGLTHYKKFKEDSTLYSYGRYEIWSYMRKQEVVNNAVRTFRITINLNGSSGISVGVDDQDRDTGDTEQYGFYLIEENGEYVVDGATVARYSEQRGWENEEYVVNRENAKEEIEEHTGFSLEEIVEMAEKNRQGFEDIMYGMKAHEIKRNKLFCIGKLAVLHILLIAFVLYMNWDAVKRGIRRSRKEGKQGEKNEK